VAVSRRTNAYSNDVTQLETPAAASRNRISAQLTVLAGADVGEVFQLNQPVVTLGRGTDAGIRLSFKSVSRAHACIHQLEGNRHEIEDLGSSNGTLLNDQPVVGRRPLRSGDRIRLGPRVLLQFATIDHFDLQLQELARLETVSQLSAAVNHDLNNLLSVLTCSVAYLASLDPSTTVGTPDVAACLQDMQLAALNAGELTQRLSTLVRQPDASINERVHLSELCEEVARMLKRTLSDRVGLEVQIEPDLWISGNRAWIHQLLMNPCVNARDAIAGAGVIRMQARRAEASEVAQHSELEPGPHVLISIEDTGQGIPEELLTRVFEPFFTTKGAGKGTGLGLATVARVAKEQGGVIDLSSELGVGTRLRILLPANARRAVSGVRPSVRPKSPTPRETLARELANRVS
jgi:signal transduction histidine kinase